MARGISLLSLLVALLVAGWLLTAQHSGTSKRQATQAVAEAQQAANGVAFQQAQTELEAYHALNGTYAGASLGGFGVTLVRADASSYCVQDSASHLAGPGGKPAPGAC
jgi:type II secretory pathway pseudopilin PulG